MIHGRVLRFFVSRRSRHEEATGCAGPTGYNQMLLAHVVGTLVSTQKNPKLEGAKLLLVQPLTLDDRPRGTAVLAVDSVGAGVNEKVLIVLEGRAAGEALGRKGAPVDAAIVGIVDHVEYADPTASEARDPAGGAGDRQPRPPAEPGRRRRK